MDKQNNKLAGGEKKHRIIKKLSAHANRRKAVDEERQT
jgi:hypothetical protein